MGDTQILQAKTTKQGKWSLSDCLFQAVEIKVECRVPTADPLLFDNNSRRRYGAHLIHRVQAAGTWSVLITAFDCTPYEAVSEYIQIVNKYNGHDDHDGSPETDEI